MSRMKLSYLCAATIFLVGCGRGDRGADLYYPSPDEWETRPPEELGLDPAALRAAVEYAAAHLTQRSRRIPASISPSVSAASRIRRSWDRQRRGAV